MLILFAILFIPLVEISLFIFIGSAIGLFPTLFSIIFTAIIGIKLIKYQGAVNMANIRNNMENKRELNKNTFNIACLFVAAIFLIIPGFFTDILGFLLLIPPLQKLFWQYLEKRLVKKGFNTNNYYDNSNYNNNNDDSNIIDAKWTDVTKDTDKK